MNYHGLTMEESKDSPQRRYQHIVICSVIAIGFTYSVYISGVLLSIQPFETKFPGGTFCYKDFTRDYAASMGLGRRLQKDILAGFPEAESDDNDDEQKKALKARKKMIEDRVHHIYLDNPEDIGGNNQRFMTGVLTSGGAERKSYCDPLFEKNPALARNKKLYANLPNNEKGASALYDETVYKSVSLPSVDSVAIRFTFSDGFASALALSYKVIPELRKLAVEKGAKDPVVISQCSVAEKECIHYVPLSKGVAFHDGRPVAQQHLDANPEVFDPIGIIKNGLRVVFPFLKPYIENADVASSESGAEL